MARLRTARMDRLCDRARLKFGVEIGKRPLYSSSQPYSMATIQFRSLGEPMRRHRTIRVLLIPALAAPLALTALFATGGSAWARGQNLPVSCVGMTGNSGGTL